MLYIVTDKFNGDLLSVTESEQNALSQLHANGNRARLYTASEQVFQAFNTKSKWYKTSEIIMK